MGDRLLWVGSTRSLPTGATRSLAARAQLPTSKRSTFKGEDKSPTRFIMPERVAQTDAFAEIIERCQAYKAEAQVDVICPNGLRTWEEIQEAIRL